ncbi:coiled-coil domain-containing protein 12 [Leptinotarsa decemlineata]|uniref:coiled-coil domain-containing protein 12 n=1 Tax=Leptinotarsa decemlineata TaxID=7539 RepID=UPI003D30AB5B
MSTAQSNIGNAEDEALKRKEKLIALKRKREMRSESNSENSNADGLSLPKPHFRSYKPTHETLQEFVLDPTKPGDVTSEVKDQLESAKSEIVIDQLDVTSLAPRKPNWDLKRDVAKKLEKLEHKTQKAIAELIRERLRASSGEGDLAAIVNTVNTTSEVEE